MTGEEWREWHRKFSKEWDEKDLGLPKAMQ